ncbi:MAG: glycoside hydrolase family 2 TIM barrel-domain containing protein [Rikenellaceae bacterium]
MKLNKFSMLLIGLVTLCSYASAQRVTYTINESWRFAQGQLPEAAAVDFDDSQWEGVTIPHSWNAVDAVDDTPEYYRGECWYRKTLVVDREVSNYTPYIIFEGANEETELYVNGVSVGSHKGGYTFFSFDVSDHLHQGENTIAIKVDNKYNPDIAPLTADFTFFGGIYRDVYLSLVPKLHINTGFYASSGVFITTPEVSKESAEVVATVKLKNNMGAGQKVVVENTLLDPNGAKVAVVKKSVKVDSEIDVVANISVDSPMLWDTKNPNIYQLHTRILTPKGELIDSSITPMGLRWFSFDKDRGFFLNGEHLKLVGTCRHQCYEGVGNALTDQMHIRDIKLLKEMGGNFLRISHYPQDPTIIEMCDRLGIVTSVEVPLINYVTMSDGFRDNSVEMATEMVYQSFNSPSIVMWAYMNEIMLRPPYKTDESIDQAEYFKYTENVAAVIEKRIKELDPYRYTMMAFHSSPAIYQEVGLTSIPDILGWNVYSGWYSGSFSDFEKTMDKYHEMFPDKPMLLTEYGADVDPRLHGYHTERFDFTSEYGVRYHRHYLPEIMSRDFIAGSNIWNLNDFHSEPRRDAVPFVNNKGITGTDRERKDSYYLYKARLSAEPVLQIGNASWKSRSAVGESGVVRQELLVFTNAAEVTLSVNGVEMGVAKVVDNCATFEAEYKHGENIISASAVIDSKPFTATEVVNFDIVPKDLKSDKIPFTQMSVMMGSKRYYEERKAETCWIPEQEYSSGSWGYVGGEAVRTKTRYGSLPNSDLNILGTEDDPIFQTQREGLEAFVADLPDGRYSVYLYLCELQSGKEREALAYNLGNDAIVEDFEARVFDISINGIKQISGLDIAQQYGSERAVVKKFVVDVVDGQGLSVEFGKVLGEPILNAIKIYKNY